MQVVLNSGITVKLQPDGCTEAVCMTFETANDQSHPLSHFKVCWSGQITSGPVPIPLTSSDASPSTRTGAFLLDQGKTYHLFEGDVVIMRLLPLSRNTLQMRFFRA
jgi:hypothetical protein